MFMRRDPVLLSIFVVTVIDVIMFECSVSLYTFYTLLELFYISTLHSSKIKIQNTTKYMYLLPYLFQMAIMKGHVIVCNCGYYSLFLFRLRVIYYGDCSIYSNYKVRFFFLIYINTNDCIFDKR